MVCCKISLQHSVVTQSSLCSARGGFSSVLDAGNLYPSNEGACVLVNSCDPAVTGSSWLFCKRFAHIQEIFCDFSPRLYPNEWWLIIPIILVPWVYLHYIPMVSPLHPHCIPITSPVYNHPTTNRPNEIGLPAPLATYLWIYPKVAP